MKGIIFIHGLESSGQGYKGRFFRKIFPNILTPDFKGELNERMEQLITTLLKFEKISIIGSSFGGLMATIYAEKFPEKVSQLILLAPALNFYNFNKETFNKINTPTTIIHGSKDEIVPLFPTKKIAEQIFKNLDFITVDDNHLLHKTIENINWLSLLK